MCCVACRVEGVEWMELCGGAVRGGGRSDEYTCSKENRNPLIRMKGRKEKNGVEYPAFPVAEPQVFANEGHKDIEGRHDPMCGTMPASDQKGRPLSLPVETGHLFD